MRGLRGLKWVFLLLPSFLVSPLCAAERVKFFASADSPIQARTVRDIDRLLANPVKIKLDSRTTSGPAETLEKMHQESSWSLGILPSDAAYAYSLASTSGFPDANQLFAPIRVIGTLHKEDIFLIARRDSALNTIQDIETARINVGPARGKTALSVGTMYHLMFGKPIAEKNLLSLSHAEALVNLISGKTIDVVALVGEHPQALLADMKPDARQYIKLLRFDATHQSSARVLEVYAARTILAASYPNVLVENLPVLGLSSQLVAYRPRLGRAEPVLTRFVGSWCANSARIRSLGYLKSAALGDEPAAQGHRHTRGAPVLPEAANCQ